MIIIFFLFVIFPEKAEDFGVVTSFSGGNAREISSPQQRGDYIKKIEFKFTVNQ